MLLLGIDLGSSSVKASVIDGETGECLASEFYPKEEMKIIARQPGWAEQDPEEWWSNLKFAVAGCTAVLATGKKIFAHSESPIRCTDSLLLTRTKKYCVRQ
jgi:sugar (pentulose or hexulose) kinase